MEYSLCACQPLCERQRPKQPVKLDNGVCVYLHIQKQALQGAEWVVDGQVIGQHLHQLEFKSQDDISKFFSVTFQIAHILHNGNVELFHLTGQVHAR